MNRVNVSRRARHALAVGCAAAGFCLFASGAYARGVTDKLVTVGQSVALSGGVGEHGRALVLGAQAYIARVNRAGGVSGRRILVETRDDGGDAKRAEDNARALVRDHDVVALFSGAEGGPCVAMTGYAAAARVPVIGCAGGSPELREPFNRFSFPVRAAHLDEFAKLVEYAALYGRKRIGFIHSDSDTGRKHLDNVRKLAAAHGVEVVAAVPLGSQFDAAKAAASLRAAGVEAMLNHGSYGQYAEIIRATRQQGAAMQYLAVNSGAQQLVRSLDADAVGLIFSQVVPFPWFDATPVVREYREALKAHAPEAEPSFSSLEGFINAKVLVEALRRANRNLTRASLAAALESMRDYDVGGLTVDYAADRHRGSRFVDVVVVGTNGRFVR
jgi:ABC-type branched-subunit amino acid transport system substrate-binding protein